MPSLLDPSAIQGDRKRGPIEAESRVWPGMTRNKLYEWFATQGYSVGAEIGVADGRNSLAMCQAIPGIKLFCIDPWEPYKGNTRGGPLEQHLNNAALAAERLAPFNATLLRSSSAAMAPGFASVHGLLDFVYIDGNHSFDYVMQDIILWSRNVRPGGVVAGHDYYRFRDAGVIEAVNAYTAAHGITEWALTDEREPSFWWVKP